LKTAENNFKLRGVRGQTSSQPLTALSKWSRRSFWVGGLVWRSDYNYAAVSCENHRWEVHAVLSYPSEEGRKAVKGRETGYETWKHSKMNGMLS